MVGAIVITIKQKIKDSFFLTASPTLRPSPASPGRKAKLLGGSARK